VVTPTTCVYSAVHTCRCPSVPPECLEACNGDDEDRYRHQPHHPKKDSRRGLNTNPQSVVVGNAAANARRIRLFVPAVGGDQADGWNR
jgi:hypothetical protein